MLGPVMKDRMGDAKAAITGAASNPSDVTPSQQTALVQAMESYQVGNPGKNIQDFKHDFLGLYGQCHDNSDLGNDFDAAFDASGFGVQHDSTENLDDMHLGIHQINSSFSVMGSAISSTASVVGSGISSLGSTAVSAVSSGVSTAVSGVSSIASTAVSGVSSIASTAISGVSSVASTAVSAVSSGISTVGSGVSSIASTVGSGVSSLVTQATSGASSAMTHIGDAVSDGLHSTASHLGQIPGVGSAISNSMDHVASSVSGGMQRGASGVSSIGTAAGNAVSSGVSGVGSTVSSGISHVMSTISSGVSSGMSVATSVVTSGMNVAKSGVSSGMSVVSSGVSVGMSAVTYGVHVAGSAVSSSLSLVGSVGSNAVGTAYSAVTSFAYANFVKPEVDAWKPVASDMGQFGQLVANTWNHATSAVSGVVPDFFHQLGQGNVSGAFNSVGSHMTNLGSALTSGDSQMTQWYNQNKGDLARAGEQLGIDAGMTIGGVALDVATGGAFSAAIVPAYAALRVGMDVGIQAARGGMEAGTALGRAGEAGGQAFRQGSQEGMHTAMSAGSIGQSAAVNGVTNTAMPTTPQDLTPNNIGMQAGIAGGGAALGSLAFFRGATNTARNNINNAGRATGSGEGTGAPAPAPAEHVAPAPTPAERVTPTPTPAPAPAEYHAAPTPTPAPGPAAAPHPAPAPASINRVTPAPAPAPVHTQGDTHATPAPAPAQHPEPTPSPFETYRNSAEHEDNADPYLTMPPQQSNLTRYSVSEMGDEKVSPQEVGQYLQNAPSQVNEHLDAPMQHVEAPTEHVGAPMEQQAPMTHQDIVNALNKVPNDEAGNIRALEDDAAGKQETIGQLMADPYGTEMKQQVFDGTKVEVGPNGGTYKNDDVALTGNHVGASATENIQQVPGLNVGELENRALNGATISGDVTNPKGDDPAKIGGAALMNRETGALGVDGSVDVNHTTLGMGGTFLGGAKAKVEYPTADKLPTNGQQLVTKKTQADRNIGFSGDVTESFATGGLGAKSLLTAADTKQSEFKIPASDASQNLRKEKQQSWPVRRYNEVANGLKRPDVPNAAVYKTKNANDFSLKNMQDDDKMSYTTSKSATGGLTYGLHGFRVSALINGAKQKSWQLQRLAGAKGNNAELILSSRGNAAGSMSAQAQMFAELRGQAHFTRGGSQGFAMDLDHPDAKQALTTALQGKSKMPSNFQVPMNEDGLYDAAKNSVTQLRSNYGLPTGVKRTFVDAGQRKTIMGNEGMPAPYPVPQSLRERYKISGLQAKQQQAYEVNLRARDNGATVTRSDIQRFEHEMIGNKQTYERNLQHQTHYSFDGEGNLNGQTNEVRHQMTTSLDRANDGNLMTGVTKKINDFGYNVDNMGSLPGAKGYSATITHKFSDDDMDKIAGASDQQVRDAAEKTNTGADRLQNLVGEMRGLNGEGESARGTKRSNTLMNYFKNNKAGGVKSLNQLLDKYFTKDGKVGATNMTLETKNEAVDRTKDKGYQYGLAYGKAADRLSMRDQQGLAKRVPKLGTIIEEGQGALEKDNITKTLGGDAFTQQKKELAEVKKLQGELFSRLKPMLKTGLDASYIMNRRTSLKPGTLKGISAAAQLTTKSSIKT